MKGILDSAKAIEKKIIEDRRHLHQNPEVGFDLPNTSEYVKQQLSEMGIEPKDCGGPVDQKIRDKFLSAGFPDMVNSTGVVATIGSGSPCILLRGDMDALPMRETSGLEFQSTKSAAHTCGHDSHTAMLLGAARILKEHDVKLMFQPGEELGCAQKQWLRMALWKSQG